MGYIASLICSIVTFIMLLLQLSLSLGAPFGEYALGGQHKVLPRKMRLVSITFAFVYIFFIISYLQKGEVVSIGLSSTFVNTFIIINTVFLAYAIIGNGFITKSRKERLVMTPISIFEFICSVVVLIWA